MFATVLVTLPSAFTGGALCLSYKDVSTTIDLGAESGSATSVVSWRTGVAPEMKPITLGHCLALSYNLVNTTGSPLPSLPDLHESRAHLRQIFMSWNESLYTGPQKIICLLDSNYAQKDIGRRSLEGTDALLVSLIDGIAKELSFRLGFSIVDREESTFSHRTDNLGLKLTKLVDVDGRLIRNSEHDIWDKYTDTVPARLFTAVINRSKNYIQFVSDTIDLLFSLPIDEFRPSQCKRQKGECLGGLFSPAF